MGLFSLTVLPPPMFSLTLLRFSPSSTPLCHETHRRCPLSSTSLLSLTHCAPRASLSSSNDSTESNNEEDPFQRKEVSKDDADVPENSPTDHAILNESNVNSAAFSFKTDSSPSSPSSSYASPVNNVAALGFEKDRRQQEQLGETLAALSQSLALLSSTLTEVSSAVRVLSAALTGIQVQSTAASSAYLSPPERRDLREAEARRNSVDPPEPWDNMPVLATASAAAAQGITGEGIDRDEEDIVPPYLVEQNRKAHKLAYRLQQAFIQARIEGLGKPFELAVEEFAEACMECHTVGIGLKELQLQLVLQDGSLTGAFAIRNQRWSVDPILNEESRIRSLWVRLVYATLAQLDPIENKDEDLDPIDSFVKQVLQMAFEKGYDLERLKLEQNFAGSEISSGAVKAMRENQYLILLTLEKAKTQND